MKTSRVIPFLMVGAVFVVIGVLVGLTVRVFPVQASAESVSVDALFNFMLAIAVVVFLIVEGGIIYSILRFRRRAGDETDGIPLHGNTALEITWTTIPAIIVFVLSIVSYQVFAATRAPSDDMLTVRVQGQQFQWTFFYDMPPDSDPAVTPELRERIAQYMVSADLYLPVGRRIQAALSSRDVIHAFYVPEFRIKEDAVPGRTTNVYFTPIKPLESWVLCAELCGVGHAAMSQINRIFVVEESSYEKFVADLYAQAKETANNPRAPEVGKQLVAQKYPCGTCHVIGELGLKGAVGPSLNGVATRAEGHAAASEGLFGGTDAAAYLRGSLVKPNAYVVSGYDAGLMPQNYGDPTIMSEDDLEAIINYLLTLKAE
ncbi:MAG TPA: cytochrome c oxidase subunit II [Aggregatilineales bacterium]|nr:cytochrome c oxidase subunit II [Anaerolineales bacterium]HRE49353.1 cytochrome c oxidase subunit II [Aggregatilineales bacterium]